MAHSPLSFRVCARCKLVHIVSGKAMGSSLHTFRPTARVPFAFPLAGRTTLHYSLIMLRFSLSLSSFLPLLFCLSPSLSLSVTVSCPEYHSFCVLSNVSYSAYRSSFSQQHLAFNAPLLTPHPSRYPPLFPPLFPLPSSLYCTRFCVLNYKNEYSHLYLHFHSFKYFV